MDTKKKIVQNRSNGDPNNSKADGDHVIALTEMISQPLIIIGDDYRIMYANSSFHKMFGTTAATTGRSFFEICSRQWNNENLKSVLATIIPESNRIEDFEIEIDTPDFGRCILLLRINHFEGSSITQPMIIIAIDDVTKVRQLNSERHFSQKLERQVAERTKKLRESQAFLQSILNSTHYGIASYEAIRSDNGQIVDFLITYTNNEVPGNFGMKPAEVTGKTCREVYPGILKNGVFEKMVHCMETGKPEQYEISVEEKGKDIWLTATIEKINESVTVTSKNITYEKKAELHLQAMNRLLANKNRELEEQILSEFSENFASYKTGNDFFEFLVQGVSQKTKMDYVILGEFINQDDDDFVKCFAVSAFGKITENFSYPVKGGPCAQVLKGRPFSQVSGCLEQFPESEIVKTLDAEGYVGHPLMDTRGNCVGLICAIHKGPITDRRYVESLLKIAAKRSEMEFERLRNERMLEEKNAELELNNKELESFNYIASHDLQEPLRKIQLFYSRILDRDRDKLSESSLEYFSSINNAADRMQNLIEALLAYSTANYTGMIFEKTDLNRILDDVKSDLEDMIEAKKAVIESETLPKVSVIPFQFRQLLSNLISNGIKYSKRDVSPIITIRVEQSSEQETKGKRYWKISVADNGIGFEQQYEHKIFELFQRLHGKNEFVGTGIGLAICKKIIDNHKGFIQVKSTPGQGSTFTIYLPVKN